MSTGRVGERKTVSRQRLPLNNMKTASHLCRKIIAAAVAPLGYHIDGNHLFANADKAALDRGCWRPSVSDKPARHSARVVRAADLLAKTYL